MARVFVASDTRLGRKVVVKVLSPELAEGTSARRFEHEIQIAARTYAWGVLAYECLTNAHRTSAFVVPLRYRSRTV
jgi:serine/threonine protein kinase